MEKYIKYWIDYSEYGNALIKYEDQNIKIFCESCGKEKDWITEDIKEPYDKETGLPKAYPFCKDLECPRKSIYKNRSIFWKILGI